MSLTNKRRFRSCNFNSIKKLFEKAFACMETFNSVDSAAEELASFHNTLIEKFKKVEQFNEEIIYLIEDDKELDIEEDTSTEFTLYFRRNILLIIEGQALSTIKGLALTYNNFDVAMNLLKERYNNKQQLISTHMNSLLSLDKITYIKDLSMLRKSYDNLETQIRNLENLNVTSSMYGPLLIPILMQKLPEELNLIISRQFQGHISSKCLSRIKCYECSSRHHAAMCEKKHQLQPSDSQLTSIAGASKGHSVLLQTALVTVTSGSTELRNCRILFDNCSQLSYISPVIRKRLDLKTIDQKKIIIKTFGNKCMTETLDKVQFCILDINNMSIPVSCYVKEICAPINGQNIEFAIKHYSHLKGLKLAERNCTDKNVRVDILIGADFYWSFVENEVIKGVDGPVALKSKLGFLLSGNVIGNSDNCSVLHSHVLKVSSEFSSDQAVFHNSMLSFWDSEAIGTTTSEINDVVYENFKKEIQFNEHSKRYEVSLPFKMNHDLISDNYTYCIKRLAPVLKKLSKDNKLLMSYNSIIKEQLCQGVIEKVNNHKIKFGNVHHLPHRPVVRDDKSTTKVRMVFDASASIDGPSLNDCLNAGPSLTTSLFGVLLRFRCYKYAFISDIEKAFLQISIKDADRDFVRFLWVKNVDTVNTDPDFVKKMMLALHVDDLNSGSNDLNQCINFFTKTRDCLHEANFNLRKVESNSMKLEQKIQPLNYKQMTETKVLGQSWDKDSDEFTYSFNGITSHYKHICSKRDVMKFIASIFDPMGLINPVIVRCKCLFQKLCIAKYSWDDLMSGDILEEWHDIIFDFCSLNKLTLPRWILSDSYLSNTNVKLELHAFADASLKANGTCIYLRCIINDSQCFATLVASKSRVAPVNKMTVPRLELKAMVLLCSLLLTVKSEFKNLNINKIFCWTDPTICLHWLNNSNQKYEAFTENRLVKIRTLFAIEFWKYVESTRNPADIISRGSPDYLNDILIPWPIYNLLEPNVGEGNTCLLATVKPLNINLEFINIGRFSSYEQLNRITACVLRFVKCLKIRIEKTCVVIKPTLSADEIERAKTLKVQNEQRDIMTNKNFKQLKNNLGLRVVDGIIRCHGRMDNAPIPRDAKFPIFIPHSSRLSKFLIVYFHKLVKHNGLKETLSELRTKFWIPQCRRLVRNIILKCYVCQYFEGLPNKYPPSPPLPLSRLCDYYPFKYTAVDYAGPVFI
nr:uncharacterized protein LOC124815072 [Hydra vulgaris]